MLEKVKKENEECGKGKRDIEKERFLSKDNLQSKQPRATNLKSTEYNEMTWAFSFLLLSIISQSTERSWKSWTASDAHRCSCCRFSWSTLNSWMHIEFRNTSCTNRRSHYTSCCVWVNCFLLIRSDRTSLVRQEALTNLFSRMTLQPWLPYSLR